MKIRKFRPGEELLLKQLFFHTIRTINRRDYSEAQVRAWAPDEIEDSRWLRHVEATKPWVCELDGRIAGYTDLQDDGYIDHFYVHHECQGQGVGKALFAHIEAEALRRGLGELYSHVSLTARPFFESRGFRVEKRQQVRMGEEALTNFVMRKRL